MQIYCDGCGEALKTSKKMNNKRRSLIKSPKSYKIIICTSCGKKNFIKI